MSMRNSVFSFSGYAFLAFLAKMTRVWCAHDGSLARSRRVSCACDLAVERVRSVEVNLAEFLPLSLSKRFSTRNNRIIACGYSAPSGRARG